MYFNNNDRKSNIFKSSVMSAGCSIINVIMGFAYRTIFLLFLSAEYLGINGLFTNVLSLLSLAELGITSAITYRFYKPINNEDIEKVGQLMNFFKHVYRSIMIFIFVLGLSLLPFIDKLVADPSEVPADVNLQLVYLLFLVQTASTYLFSYKQTMLTVDQKQYTFSIFQTGVNLLKYLSQIIVLFVLKKYTVSLAIGISVTIVLNFFVSLWVETKYKKVFQVKSQLTKEEKKSIFIDTKASMYHKIGGTVLTSTDNIVLTKFISLAITGIYSNYSLITSSLTTLLNQLFCSFTASIGNAYVDLMYDKFYEMYRRMINLNFWIVGLTTSLLYLLIDDFIYIWLGKGFELDSITVIVLCSQFYIEMIRLTSISFVNATGLFVKDKIRPLIEAVLNLVISIIAVKLIGIPGVFLGTIISHFVTVTWREPYLLYKYIFKNNVVTYWKSFAVHAILTICFIASFKIMFSSLLSNTTILVWILKVIIIAAAYCLISIIIFARNDIFMYYKKLIIERVHG